MAAPLKPDASLQYGGTQILARFTDGNHIAIFNWANADLPDAEWFEVNCDDAGCIVLTPVQAEVVPAEAHAWAQEKDAIAAAQQQRPYQHLTVDELREVEELTTEEWFDELRARGIVSHNNKVPGQLSIKPVARVPGALERFLKERRGEA